MYLITFQHHIDEKGFDLNFIKKKFTNFVKSGGYRINHGRINFVYIWKCTFFLMFRLLKHFYL